MIEEEDEGDPEEDEDESPSAELINKKFKINSNAWENVEPEEKSSQADFQQIKGRARLEVACDTKMVVPEDSPAQTFYVSISYTTPSGTTILDPEEYNLQPGEELVFENQGILKDGFEGDWLVVVYIVNMKPTADPFAVPQPADSWSHRFDKE